MRRWTSWGAALLVVALLAVCGPLRVDRVQTFCLEIANQLRDCVGVNRGDTLAGIASRYAVSVADLRRWNAISPNGAVTAGQSLRITSDLAPTRARHGGRSTKESPRATRRSALAVPLFPNEEHTNCRNAS